MNIALTFNVKPESSSFLESLSLNQSIEDKQLKVKQDTYAEWDTWDTINAVKDALSSAGDVTLVEANEDVINSLLALKPDIVFNIAEGYFGTGREAQIPAILEMLNIPYTGSDSLTLALCLDKSRTKEILSYHNIPNAPFMLIEELNEIKNFNLNYPVIVKPVSEGSSKGIYSNCFVHNYDELEKQVKEILKEYNQPALAEEFLPGREFTVAVYGNGNEIEILPIVEIMYNDFPDDFVPIYSYEAKWILDTKENPLEVFQCPANLDKNLLNKIHEVVRKAYKTLKCRDWSRIDIRLDKNNIPNIIEVNPLPGILPDPKDNSCFPKAARAKGYDYKEMLLRTLYEGAKRYNLL